MPANISKRQQKSFASSKPTQTSAIPHPFAPAPSNLFPLLPQLDPAAVHLLHIDRHQPAYKRQIFLIPLFLNALVALGLAYRIYTGVPTYWAILQAFLGYESTATVDTGSTTRGQQLAVLGWRVGMFVVDFLLFRLLGPWPLTFFFEGPSNPVLWRWNLGFRKEEMVIRVSRNWGAKDLMEGVKQGDANAFWKTRVLPATGMEECRKTGYLMLGANWDLDFAGMVDAHTLLDRGEMKVEDLDCVVLVHMENQGWVSWRWRETGDFVEDRRQQVVRFKEVLTNMGKESLFWKWTEIVEEERDGDGGFSVQGQENVARRVREEFTKVGVNFDEVVEGIGGLQEVGPEA